MRARLRGERGRLAGGSGSSHASKSQSANAPIVTLRPHVVQSVVGHLVFDEEADSSAERQVQRARRPSVVSVANPSSRRSAGRGSAGGAAGARGLGDLEELPSGRELTGQHSGPPCLEIGLSCPGRIQCFELPCGVEQPAGCLRSRSCGCLDLPVELFDACSLQIVGSDRCARGDEASRPRRRHRRADAPPPRPRRGRIEIRDPESTRLNGRAGRRRPRGQPGAARALRCARVRTRRRRRNQWPPRPCARRGVRDHVPDLSRRPTPDEPLIDPRLGPGIRGRTHQRMSKANFGADLDEIDVRRGLGSNAERELRRAAPASGQP